MSGIRDNKSEEITHWLNTIELNDYDNAESICSSVVDSCSSIIESSSDTESGEEFALGETIENGPLRSVSSNDILKIPALTFNNVSITNSTNVHLGTMYKVNGNLNINVINNEHYQDCLDVQPRLKQQNKSPIVRPACLIFPRIRWLAMDPLSECCRMTVPIEYVVICQTTTASSTEQAKNVGIIRDLQTLNVESQGFNDIIYNFLIGCDGIVYEGRGWDVQGDHTNAYNHRSIGIAFVGNFRNNLPPERALNVCRKLFTRGVTEGYLSRDYKIVPQCECLNESLDNVLYAEIKTWEHYYNVQNENKS